MKFVKKIVENILKKRRELKGYEVIEEGESGVTLNYKIPRFTVQKGEKFNIEKIGIKNNFYQKNKHILFQKPRISNYDFLSLILFTEFFKKINKNIITICEFGVWRGAFLELAAIWAEENGKKINLIGFDTFSIFPDFTTEKEGDTKNRSDLKNRISKISPYSQEKIKEKLLKYKSVNDIKFYAGDITKQKVSVTADIFHIDVDSYTVTKSALSLIGNKSEDPIIIVDDYYQPSWIGMIDIVNEFCKENNMVPVNIADYFGYKRSLRASYLYILVSLATSRGV